MKRSVLLLVNVVCSQQLRGQVAFFNQVASNLLQLDRLRKSVLQSLVPHSEAQRRVIRSGGIGAVIANSNPLSHLQRAIFPRHSEFSNILDEYERNREDVIASIAKMGPAKVKSRNYKYFTDANKPSVYKYLFFKPIETEDNFSN